MRIWRFNFLNVKHNYSGMQKYFNAKRSILHYLWNWWCRFSLWIQSVAPSAGQRKATYKKRIFLMPWPALKFKFFQGGHQIWAIMKRKASINWRVKTNNFKRMGECFIQYHQCPCCRNASEINTSYSYEWNDNTTLMK